MPNTKIPVVWHDDPKWKATLIGFQRGERMYATVVLPSGEIVFPKVRDIRVDMKRWAKEDT